VLVGLLIAQLVVVGLLTWGLWGHRADHVIAAHVRRLVIVTCKDGAAFRGVLVDADRHSIALRQAEELGDGGTSVPADGMVLIFRADVAFVQMP
jgi:small nuclear ribonucleoprotein (snRNP)-like protein